MSNLATIKGFFENESMKKKFTDMLGTKAQGFMVSVLNTVSNNKSLQGVEANSIMFAAATAATLDLPINQNLGFAYIVPYTRKFKEVVNGKEVWKSISEAQFQLGYKGFIQLAQRSGQFKTISASPVYEGQISKNDPLRGIEFNWDNKVSDKVIGYVAFFELLNGFEKTLYMTTEELQKHGKQYSQSYKKGGGLWNDNFESMAIKTVIKLLLSKFAPLSIDMQKALISDQSVIKNIEGEIADYPDNAPETVADVAERKDIDRVLKLINKATTADELDELFDTVSELDVQEVIDAYNVKKEELEK